MATIAATNVVAGITEGQTLAVNSQHGVLAGDTDPYGYALGVSAEISSCCSIGTVPTLPTTIPAARFASSTAVSICSPAASPAVSVAITVSPAPDTSKTSRALVGI